MSLMYIILCRSHNIRTYVCRSHGVMLCSRLQVLSYFFYIFNIFIVACKGLPLLQNGSSPNTLVRSCVSLGLGGAVKMLSDTEIVEVREV